MVFLCFLNRFFDTLYPWSLCFSPRNWDTIKASSQRDATKMDALTEAARYFKFFTGGERTMDEKQFGRVFADLTET
eukprot:m.106311 g.106311  ORF g.106311 m.106311 type:complete len:76 (+) comp13298_c0_seq1:1747-1974(+)